MGLDVSSHLHPVGSFDLADHPVPTGREEVWRFTPLKRLRGGGLLLFDLLRPVKHEFARRTMGLAGRQPRLVRGLPL